MFSTSSTEKATSRLRYSECRSQSVQRNPASYWKRSDLAVRSRPTSRESSPTPIWSRPPTAPLDNRFSGWNTLNQSYSVSSGQITPTESVVNLFDFDSG